MRDINITEIVKMEVDQGRLNPRPFPGLYPTRWLIVGETRRIRAWPPRGQGKKIYYLGKPNSAVAFRLSFLVRRYQGTIGVWEFDKGGLIRRGFINFPTTRMTTENYNLNLVGLYYPTGAHYDSLVDRWDEGYWKARKKLILPDGHSVMTYSNGEEWNTTSMEGILEWVNNRKFQWK